MTALYREFVLRGPSQWNAAVALVRENAKAQNDQGKPLRLIVTAEDEKRHDQQNRFYWGAVLRMVSEQAWAAGKRFDKDTWHEYYARMFGVCEDVTLPDGEVIVRRKSTTQMTVSEFSEYLNEVQAHAAVTFGVIFQ